MSDIIILGNYNSTVPAAPAGRENITFAVDRTEDIPRFSASVKKNTPCYLYTSANPAVAVTSERFYPDRSGTIETVRSNVVKGNGSRSTDIDVLKNGVSIFTVSDKPNVLTNEYVSDFKVPDTKTFTPTDYLQIKINDAANTTGPIRVYINFV
jgi:hypothetical protein